MPFDGPLVGPMDASNLLDPPAGKHGFLQVEEGRFVFEDGTPIRFFGVNIQGGEALPTHETALRLAERLSQLGINLVRLHLIDAAWAEPNLFDSRYEDTRHLSKASLDRLDYFIAELKRQGVYVYLDLLVRRKFTREDGVVSAEGLEGGAKMAAQYDQKLIELQKMFAHDLLMHENPYTKRKLVNEPAIALLDIINESSLFKLRERTNKVPPHYLEELAKLWVAFLPAKGKTPADFPFGRSLKQEGPLMQEFLADLQVRYFDEMSEFLRDLGLKIPISGSNLPLDGPDLLTHAGLDFIDRHAYWDHPKGGFGNQVQFHNRLLIETVDSNNLLVKLSRQRVRGMPFVVSEWNIAWPNEYRAIGPLLMTAYALFQDWDGLLQFNYQGVLVPLLIESNFDVSTKPEIFLQMASVARIFYRRDISPAHQRVAYPILNAPEIPAAAALIHGIERVTERGGVARDENGKKRSPWVSDTQELHWDQSKGIISINTSRTQAALGRIGKTSVKLKDVTFEVTTPFASLILTSLDDQTLSSSKRLLLTAVARSENSGMVYNATRTFLRTSGTPPILMEPVEGMAQLILGQRAAPQVFLLDTGGHRAGELRAKISHRALEIPLGEGPAYEILFEEMA